MSNGFSLFPRTMRQLLPLWMVFVACEACARTRGGAGGGGAAPATPGSPAPGSPGGETPGNTPGETPGEPPATETPPKVCPMLMEFSPDPPASYQLVSPPTTTVTGDTTTASCPEAGTSFLFPDGTSKTAVLSCSTVTGTWSFDDDTPFDATTTSIACGAKCFSCSNSKPPPLMASPTFGACDDPCNTPVNPVCDDPAAPTLVGANKDGDIYTGTVVVEPLRCVGGEWVDGSNAVYQNMACNPPASSCTAANTRLDLLECQGDTGKACVAYTSVSSVLYTGTNALFAGQMVLSPVCPPTSPIFYAHINTGGTPIIQQLDLPLSSSDNNFLCTSTGRPTYYDNGVSASQVFAVGCTTA